MLSAYSQISDDESNASDQDDDTAIWLPEAMGSCPGISNSQDKGKSLLRAL